MSFRTFIRKVENKKPFLYETPLCIIGKRDLMAKFDKKGSFVKFQQRLIIDHCFSTFKRVMYENNSLRLMATDSRFFDWKLDEAEQFVAIDKTSNNVYTANNLKEFFHFQIEESSKKNIPRMSLEQLSRHTLGAIPIPSWANVNSYGSSLVSSSNSLAEPVLQTYELPSYVREVDDQNPDSE